MAKYEITIGQIAPIAVEQPMPEPSAQSAHLPKRAVALRVIPKPYVIEAGIWVVDCDSQEAAWDRAHTIFAQQKALYPQKNVEIVSVVLQYVPASEKGSNGRKSSSRLP